MKDDGIVVWTRYLKKHNIKFAGMLVYIRHFSINQYDVNIVGEPTQKLVTNTLRYKLCFFTILTVQIQLQKSDH